MGHEITRQQPEPVGAQDDPEVARVKAVLESRLRGGPAVSTRVGRFVVIERIGAGGMGVVYSAFDPQLDRKVAIKLLFEGDTDERVRARLRGEAKAMAQLAHPNVVGVYEVGEFEGRVFVAMEHVRGRTLKTWATERPRSAREVLAVCVQAGRGLAAAHAVGIVHRDFKPDNVLVGDDDRARVLDFGIARQGVPTAGEPVATDRAGDEASLKLTRTGAVLGTPAYMAPEQIRGEPVDARGDQFAFCVTVWEALTGERPFAGETVETLFDHVARGDRRAARRGTMPRGLEAVLRRGLALRPGDRHRSMDELLAAIVRNASGRRFWSRVVIGAVAITGIAAWGGSRVELERRRSACESESNAIAEVWNDAVKTRLGDALLGTGVSYAASSFEHAVPFVDAQAEGWQRAYAELCVSTEVEGERSDELWLASRACLDERRGELAALLGVLTNEADATAAQQAVSATAGLATIDTCRDDGWLARNPTIATDDISAETLRAQTWRAAGLDKAGRYAEAVELARSVHDEAGRAGHDVLRRKALLIAGTAAQHHGDRAQAESLLGEAFDLAFAADDDDVARAAAIELVETHGHHATGHEQAAWWARVAQGLQASATPGEDLLAARLDEASAAADRTRKDVEWPRPPGSYAEGARLLRTALGIRERLQGPDHPDVARTRAQLAMMLTSEAQANCTPSPTCYDEAISVASEAIDAQAKALGSDHPERASSLVWLAIAQFAAAAYEDALRSAEEAESIFTARAPDHAERGPAMWLIASVHQNRGEYAEAQRGYEELVALADRTSNHLEDPECELATVHVARGNDDEAHELYERGLATAERTFAEGSAEIVWCMSMFANLLSLRRAYDESERLHARALAAAEGWHNDLFLPPILEVYGDLQRRRGDHLAARRLYERALEIEARRVGPEWAGRAVTLVRLARAELGARDYPRARALAEQALALATDNGDRGLVWYVIDEHGNQSHLLGPGVVPSAKFVIAIAAWETGEPDQARRLAVEARDALRRAGEGHERTLSEVESWIEARDPASER